VDLNSLRNLDSDDLQDLIRSSLAGLHSISVNNNIEELKKCKLPYSEQIKSPENKYRILIILEHGSEVISFGVSSHFRLNSKIEQFVDKAEKERRKKCHQKTKPQEEMEDQLFQVTPPQMATPLIGSHQNLEISLREMEAKIESCASVDLGNTIACLKSMLYRLDPTLFLYPTTPMITTSQDSSNPYLLHETSSVDGLSSDSESGGSSPLMRAFSNEPQPPFFHLHHSNNPHLNPFLPSNNHF
jgi:hypothetical protein